MSDVMRRRASLATGGLAAVLASTCCLGPLLLVSIGVSGAWIGNLRVLEPFRPLFISIALIALFLAWRRIWRPAACAPGTVCALPATQRMHKTMFWVVVLLVKIAVVFPFVAPLFY